jgi:hypothetical protein
LLLFVEDNKTDFRPYIAVFIFSGDFSIFIFINKFCPRGHCEQLEL